MSVFDVVKLLGGLGMFLFGMKVMSEGLEKSAGEKMKDIIESLTSNIVKAVLVGMLVAALTQSSSATTVMVIGFINAGMMTLRQGVGVIMGANIGTTITAQILRLGELEGDAWYFMLLKPDTLAPLALIIGALLIFISDKNPRRKDIGEIVVGFGVLFIGMQYMENAVSSLTGENSPLVGVFSGLENPVFGIAAGAGVTALLQSSSASIGILQAIAKTGAITFAAAVPIVLGQNIGTCITALLSSIGANKNAKRAAIVHLYFNVVGTFLFMAVLYSLQSMIPFWNSAVGMGDIANFHTLFNVINTLVLLPFAGVLVTLANLTIRSDEKEETSPMAAIDKRFLSSPSLAISNTTKAMAYMAGYAKENLVNCRKMIQKRNHSLAERNKENENILDQMEIGITDYLTQISDTPLNNEENKVVASYFHVVKDIERIGDYCDNVLDNIDIIVRNKIDFTAEGGRELNVLFDAVENIIDLTVEAMESGDIALAAKVEPLEEVIDELKETLEKRHMARLKKKECNTEAGVIYLEILSNLERMADHCSNIGVALLQNGHEIPSQNTHEYLRKLHREMPEAFRSEYETYQQKYVI